MATTDGDSGLAAATLAAAVRAVATRTGLIRDSLAEPLVRAVGADLFTRVAEGELDVTELSDDRGYARLTDCVAARTRYFDGFFADAGIAGIHQAVILGSGLDARPYRLWWPRETTVFDIDQPQLVEFKTQTLRRLGVTPATNRCAVGVDLRQDWPAALRRAGFDSTQPSAWIAEGLLIAPLPPDAQNRLLDDITDLSAAGSRLAADYGGSSRHNEVADDLRARGWVTVGSTLGDLLTACGLPRLRRADVARAPVPTRYVAAVRNAAAPTTLDSWVMPQSLRSTSGPAVSLHFVPAAQDDPLAQPLLSELAVEYAQRYGSTRQAILAWLQDNPADEFTPPDGDLLIGLLDGVPVTGGAFRRFDSETAELKRIWTDRAHRRCGYARALLARLEAQIITRGYRRVYLTTGNRQPEAEALYHASGYTRLTEPLPSKEPVFPIAFAKDLP